MNHKHTIMNIFKGQINHINNSLLKITSSLKRLKDKVFSQYFDNDIH